MEMESMATDISLSGLEDHPYNWFRVNNNKTEIEEVTQFKPAGNMWPDEWYS